MAQKWIEDLEDEFRNRATDLATVNALRLHRFTVFEQEGRKFFDDLMAKAQEGIRLMKVRNAGLEELALDPSGTDKKHFTLRNSQLRPEIRVTVSLNKMSILISQETTGKATDEFVPKEFKEVDFHLDANDRLAFCVQCAPVGVEDILKLVLRPVLGL
jgi:hypothetical protein